MSRHRDIRNLDYEEEYDHAYDDEIYGYSVEEHENGISPCSEEYLYKSRESRHGLGAYLPTSNITEEEEEPLDKDMASLQLNHDSKKPFRSRLCSEEEARLNSVLDELRNVVGDQFCDQDLIKATINHNYDYESTLDFILSKSRQPSLKTVLSEQLKNRDVDFLPPKSRKKPLNSEKDLTVAAAVVLAPSKAKPKSFITKTNGNDAEKNGVCDDDSLRVNDEQKELLTLPKLTNIKLRDKTVDILKKYEKCRRQVKNLLNLVVVGHVDAGKSTLMGHLLYKQGVVSQRLMHKYEQESKKVGKVSFMYAWVLDETDEERAKGVTVDIAQRVFETATKTVTLLDAPGHQDFIPNMITGAARADGAVLVVDASKGGFEAGFESGGQTREHAILIRSLGVSELVVAVNKLDSVDWSQSRFNEITSTLKLFLKTVGFRECDVTYIPCSGLTGENLINRSVEKKFKWFSGPTLLEGIDRLKIPDREVTKSIRLCISNMYKGQGSSTCISGRLDTGFIQNGDRLLLLPQSEIITVKSVQSDSGDDGQCFAGDHVTLNVVGADTNVLRVGDFVCDPMEPIPLATRIQARIVIFNIVLPIIKGSQFDFHYQSVCESAKVRRLNALIHKSTGEVIKEKPRALLKNSCAIIDLEFDRPLCVELYQNYKELGRFMLRNNGLTVAAGVVVQILS